MKTRFILATLLLALTASGCEEKDEKNSIPGIEGLSLYWDHEVFGDEGRRLRFYLSSINAFDNLYELKFNTTATDDVITASLSGAVDEGKCPFFPMPMPAASGDPTKCSASGEFFLTDKQLSAGTYSLNIITPWMEVPCNLVVTTEKVTLTIPPNEFLSTTIDDVFPIPPDLLFGAVLYEGANNTADAEGFIERLADLGLIQTTVPNYPYRHLTVDETGYPPSKQWDSDKHSLQFLYNMNGRDAETIFTEAMNYFSDTDLNITLFTSNGDEAHMSKSEGVTVVYAKP